MSGQALHVRLRDLPVTSLVEHLGSVHVLAPDIVPVVMDASMVGTAVTCYCPAGDNMPLHQALAAAGRGDVIIVASERRRGTGLWGELATRSAMARGVAGVVADGGVRDVAMIRSCRFPVWSRFVSPIGARKGEAGNGVNIPVSCGGVIVRPGDFVVADADGVVIVPHDRVDEVVRAATARVELERSLHEALDRGELPLDVMARRRGAP